SIYLLLDSERFTHLFFRVVPPERRLEVREVSEEIHRTLARFLRGEAFLVGLVSAASFLGLEFVFHLRFALPLAVATGLFEIVPILGPIAAGTIAAAIAISQGGPGLAIGVIVFYIIIRQIEDQIVMPFVVGRAVELHPLVVLFAVLAGGALLGFLGTLLAVPIAASIKVMLSVWLPTFSEKEPAPALTAKE
ncbi:MAG: AI-2E family transporter, partial [Chloroflexota bacterium]